MLSTWVSAARLCSDLIMDDIPADQLISALVEMLADYISPSTSSTVPIAFNIRIVFVCLVSAICQVRSSAKGNKKPRMCRVGICQSVMLAQKAKNRRTEVVGWSEYYGHQVNNVFPQNLLIFGSTSSDISKSSRIFLNAFSSMSTD